MQRRTFLAAVAGALAAQGQEPPLSDPRFPRYHFRPARNWMNDPNGLLYWKGEYHMFYQYNPNAAYWGDMHWGHAVSPDMVRWKQLPLALYPDKPYDKDGVFSGCAVVHNGTPTLVYTGTKPETQCIATTSNNLRRFHKSERNPVIAAPPDGVKVTGFRDPFLWREGEDWLMALGGGFPDVGGAVFLYSSRDLVSWKYLHPLIQGEKPKTGHNWECPNFFPLGSKHVLLVSAEPFGRVLYFTGKYEGRRFTPESEGVLDAGGSLYAPQVFRDETGQWVLFGWLRETRSRAEDVKAGWSGVQSLPRVMVLHPDGVLGAYPHPNVATLRTEGTAGAQSTFHVRFPGATGRADLHIGEETLPVTATRDRLSVGKHSAPFSLPPGERCELEIFVDGSVVEVFANRRVAMTVRTYPQAIGAVSVAAPDGDVRSWAMRPSITWAVSAG